MALPYWIEQLEDGSFKIWTKTSIAANSSTVLYVQKRDGYSPDGDSVFEFFDDFEGTSLDTSKWTVGSGAWTVENGVAKTSVGAANAVVGANIQSFDKCIIEMKGSWTGGGQADSWLGILVYQDSIASQNTGYSAQFGYHSVYSVGFEKFTVAHIGYNPISYIQGEYKKLKVIAIPGNLEVVYDDSISATTTDITYTSGYVVIRAYDDVSANIDYFFIRKYADQEPTVTIQKVSLEVVYLSNPKDGDVITTSKYTNIVV